MLGHGGVGGQTHALFGCDLTKYGSTVEVIKTEFYGNKARECARSRPRKARERDQHRSGEGGEQRFALLCTETPHPAGLGNADLLHGTAGLNLANAREGLQHGEHLGLADQGI